jgi:hypothetical protein
MGQVITIPEGGMDLVLYGDKRGVITNYLYNQLQQLPASLTDFGRSVYNGVVNSYNYMTDVFTQSNILNQLNNQNVSVLNNYVQECLDFQSLQNANLTMQRYIMANPTIRQPYIDQNCDGYSSSYVDIFKGQIGKDHYDYRRVTDGMLMSTEDGFEINYYDETLEVGDKELDFVDKCRVLASWDATDWIVENCKFDFTNQGCITKRGS